MLNLLQINNKGLFNGYGRSWFAMPQCYQSYAYNIGSNLRYYTHSRNAQPDYYKVLGITRGAKESEIKTKYRELAKTWHPDTVNKETNKKKAKIKFQRIQEAYDTLIDESKRRNYDEQKDYNLGGADQSYYRHQGDGVGINGGRVVFTQSSSMDGLHMFIQQAAIMKALQEQALRQQHLRQMETERIRKAQMEEVKKYKNRKYKNQMKKVTEVRTRIKDSISKARG